MLLQYVLARFNPDTFMNIKRAIAVFIDHTCINNGGGPPVSAPVAEVIVVELRLYRAFPDMASTFLNRHFYSSFQSCVVYLAHELSAINLIKRKPKYRKRCRMKKCIVHMIWCDESSTWVADSDDVPGLALGADSFDKLVDKVCPVVPELLEENLAYKGPYEIHFMSERIYKMAAVS